MFLFYAAQRFSVNVNVSKSDVTTRGEVNLGTSASDLTGYIALLQRLMKRFPL